MQKVSELISKLDAFGTKVNLTLNAKEKTKTTFGGLATVVLIGFFVYTLVLKLKVLLNKEQQFLTNSDIFDQNPKKLSLHPNHFIFALRISKNNEVIPNNVFEINVEQEKYISEVGQKRRKATQKIQLEYCTEDHFKQLLYYNKDIQQEYINKQYQNWLCPPLNTSLAVSGIYYQDIFEFIRIQVTQCKENCGTLYNEQYTFEIDYINYVIDKTKKQAIQPYMKHEYTNFFPKQRINSMNIFYSEFELKTDHHLFSSDIIHNES